MKEDPHATLQKATRALALEKLRRHEAEERVETLEAQLSDARQQIATLRAGAQQQREEK